MARRRLAVALLCPPPLAVRVDTLRRAVGVVEPFAVPAHLTLVPPVNVAEADLDGVGTLLRAAASAVDPVEVSVGPAATFAPDSLTLHLSVDGAPADLAALGELRRRVRSGPFDRPDPWPFVPHVTLAESRPAHTLPAAVEVLGGVSERWEVRDVHLLEERRRDDGRRVWVPVREEPLGGPPVVGRGGLEVVLRPVGMVEDAVADLVGLAPAVPGLDALGRSPMAVVAEEPAAPGRPEGAAVGRVGGGAAELRALVVEPEARGLGLGAHLLAAFGAEAARRGAALVSARPATGGGRAFLARHGFTAAGDLLVRRSPAGGAAVGRDDHG